MRREVKELYAKYGVDVNKAMKELAKTKISLHCWQLDDVKGFDILTVDCPPGYFEYEYELDEPPMMHDKQKEI